MLYCIGLRQTSRSHHDAVRATLARGCDLCWLHLTDYFLKLTEKRQIIVIIALCIRQLTHTRMDFEVIVVYTFRTGPS